MQFSGYIQVATLKAVLFQDHYWYQPMWLPKSAAKIRRKEESDLEEVHIEIAYWLVNKERLEEFQTRGEPDAEGSGMADEDKKTD